MSLLADMGSGIGGWPGAIATLGQAYLGYRAGQSAQPAMPGAGMVQTMGALPALGAAGGAAVRIGARYAGAGMRTAMAWCRRNPSWCATVGGTAAVAAMVDSGQLPAMRRRRGRGISSRDLRSYRRVHNLLAGFCAPKARIRKVCA